MTKISQQNNNLGKLFKYSDRFFPFMFVVFAISFMSCNGEKAEQRPGSSWDGSAKWAAQLAGPAINEIATDAKLYTILGLRIYKDGRLPKNLGEWSITAWSATLNKEISVSIDHEGILTVSTTNSTNPPVNRDPLPDDWITSSAWCNSTDAFEAIPDFPPDLNEAIQVSSALFSQLQDCSFDSSTENGHAGLHQQHLSITGEYSHHQSYGQEV